MNADAQDQKAERALRKLIEQDVNNGPLIRQMIKRGMSAQEVLNELSRK
jgi:hypothetical protein